MKKKLAFLLSLLVIFFSFPVSATSSKNDSTFSNLNERELQHYFELARDYIDSYYSESLLEVKSSEDSKLMSNIQSTDLLASYMESKIKFENSSIREFNYELTDMAKSYKLLKWKAIKNSLLCEYAVDITFKYSDADVTSGFGRIVQILIENSVSPIICDFYVEDPAGFDSQIRGDKLDLSDSSNWISNQDFKTLAEQVNEKLQIMGQSISAEKQKLNKLQSENSDLVYLIAAEPLDFARRNKAVNYVTTNCNKASPASGSSSVPYGSFSVDCTNFISHAFLAGTFSMLVGTNGTANCWYYKSMSDRSSSWSSVNNLFSFMTWNSNNNYPKAVSYTSNDNTPFLYSPFPPNGFTSGDIIQIKYNYSGGYGYPDYGHSTMMTGTAGYQGTSYDILITSRTSAGSYNLNRKLREAYPPAPNTTSGSGNCLYRKIIVNY